MKKIIFALLVISFAALSTSSCTSSRRSRTGCPMAEGIIH